MNVGMFGSVTTTAEVGSSNIHVEIERLAKALSARHGDVKISSESNGRHLSMACPYCLEIDGVKELESRHLSINADKYLGLGSWKRRRGTFDGEACAYCMKESRPVPMEYLHNCPPLAERGIRASKARVFEAKNDPILEQDKNGNMVPESPGVEIPINVLPKDHVAVEYVLRRGLDPDELWDTFEATYCVQEKPEDRVLGRFYRQLALGFRDTPQGRLILYVYVNGVRSAWQARIIDRVVGDRYEIWHPYDNVWTPVSVRDASGEFQLIKAIQDYPKKWKISKYKTATGSARNRLLMGFDHALRMYKDTPKKDRVGFLTEGPLDVANLGAPSVALLGKFVSDQQSRLLAGAFGRILYIYDNDKYGRESAKKAERIIGKRCSFEAITIPGIEEGMDPGDLPRDVARAFIKSKLAEFNIHV